MTAPVIPIAANMQGLNECQGRSSLGDRTHVCIADLARFSLYAGESRTSCTAAADVSRFDNCFRRPDSRLRDARSHALSKEARSRHCSLHAKTSITFQLKKILIEYTLELFVSAWPSAVACSFWYLRHHSDKKFDEDPKEW